MKSNKLYPGSLKQIKVHKSSGRGEDALVVKIPQNGNKESAILVEERNRMAEIVKARASKEDNGEPEDYSLFDQFDERKDEILSK